MVITKPSVASTSRPQSYKQHAVHAQQRLLCWQGDTICDLLLNRHLAKSIFLLFKINSCLPLVTASRATPQPEAPPPITKTSNSGVFFKALMWTDLEGRGLFGCPTTVFSAAITGDNKGFCNKKKCDVTNIFLCMSALALDDNLLKGGGRED